MASIFKIVVYAIYNINENYFFLIFKYYKYSLNDIIIIVENFKQYERKINSNYITHTFNVQINFIILIMKSKSYFDINSKDPLSNEMISSPPTGKRQNREPMTDNVSSVVPEASILKHRGNVNNVAQQTDTHTQKG